MRILKYLKGCQIVSSNGDDDAARRNTFYDFMAVDDQVGNSCILIHSTISSARRNGSS